MVTDDGARGPIGSDAALGTGSVLDTYISCISNF
jgi:hypothetical protein